MASLTASKFAAGSKAADLPVVTSLSKAVVRIMGCNPGPFTLSGTATYLIGTGSRRLLLDTGDAGDTFPLWHDALAGVLEEAHAQVDTVLLTHHHHDHVGGVKGLLERAGATDAPKVAHLSAGLAGGGVAFPGLEGVPVEPLSHGTTFAVEGATLRAVATPGHTDDHVSFFFEEEKSLFSGDCILGAGTAAFQDLTAYMSSLQRLLDLNPRRIYPGHGPVVESGSDRISQYISHRRARENSIVTILRDADGPMSAVDIATAMYSSEGLPSHLLAAASRVTLLHLIKLETEGTIGQATAPTAGSGDALGAGGKDDSADKLAEAAGEVDFAALHARGISEHTVSARAYPGVVPRLQQLPQIANSHSPASAFGNTQSWRITASAAL